MTDKTKPYRTAAIKAGVPHCARCGCLFQCYCDLDKHTQKKNKD